MTLPVVKPRQVLRALKRAGFVEHHTRGSHRYLRHPDRPGLVTVPMHATDLKRGTLRSIIRQAGLTVAQFREFLG